MQYRTSGPWGAGKGANLTAEEFDQNTYSLVQMILAKADQGVGISNFVVVGSDMWVSLTDHTLLGPYTLPTVKFSFKGEWTPATQYYVNDIFTYGGSTYMVLISHVSAGSFDAGANDGHGGDYYGLLLQNAPNALPTGGAPGSVLTKASTSDYAASWVEPTLAGLSDVLQSPGPSSGDLVTYSGGHFTYVARSAVAGSVSLAGLSDVEHSPAPADGQVPQWSASAGKFIWATAGGGGSASLATLTDVSIGTPANGQALTYSASASEWVNAPLLNTYYWTTSSKTLSLDDANTTIYANGSVQTLTIPGSSSSPPVNFPSPATFYLHAGTQGEPPPTIVAEAGVVFVTPPGRIARPARVGSLIMAQQLGGDEWYFSGDLAEADVSSVVVDLGGDIAIDFLNFNADVYSYTPSRSFSFTMPSISSFQKNRRLVFVLTTSGTTSFTVGFGAGFKSTGSLTTGTVSGKVFSLEFICDGTQMVELSRTTAM